MFPKHLRIWPLFIVSHQITMFSLSFILLSFLSWIGIRGEQFFMVGVKGACTPFCATRPVKLSLNRSLMLSSIPCHDCMHALAILPLWLLVWCLARNVFLILVMCPIMKCVMHANRPNLTNFPILCPLASLRFPYNLSSQMCGVLLILLLVTIISMLVLLMTSASLLGFICLNTNLRSFISFKSFQCMVECLFDHKILAMQTNWEGGGLSIKSSILFSQGWHIPSCVMSIHTLTKLLSRAQTSPCC
jgi:hypothetical protein